MGKFALIREEEPAGDKAGSEDFIQAVFDVLVNQLGHKTSDARRMIEQALARDPDISTPEALFDEVYRGELS